MTVGESTLTKYSKIFDREQFLTIHEEMSFDEYIALVLKNPKMARNSFQYTYDMIMAKGVETFERYRKTHRRYKFFCEDAASPIYGLEETLDSLVNFIHGAAGGYGTEKRILLLHGPVGSAKSSICRIIKRGLEQYSRTPQGAWYSYKWINLPVEGDDALYMSKEDMCPMNQDPLCLMPDEMRQTILKDLNETLYENTPEDEREGLYQLRNEQDLNPRCKLFMTELLRKYEGDWEKVVQNHIRVVRRVHSEVDRVGIGTFQPKDEKNQDSTELNGDMNFRKISQYGADSDPRAFNFDGEFCVANHGFMEFIEILKLANEFLYDVLGVTQEHQIKPKKFSQIVVDEVLIGHTNSAEFQRLQENEFMEALRDRTVKVDVPYITKWSDELRVLERDYGKGKVKQHIMPHTLEITALFAILTRLKEDTGLSMRDKAKLYDGRTMPNWSEDSVKELQDKHTDEGMKGGLSVRYIQDKLSNCLAKNPKYVNVFIVLDELKNGLRSSSLITNKDDISRYERCIEIATQEYEDIVKREIFRALVADENAIVRLCAKYIDNLMASVNKEKIRNPLTGRDIDPDEKLMRSIETKIGIADTGVPDFRRMIAAFIGGMHNRKQEFKWDSNPDLRRALEKKMFEDVRDTIRLAIMSTETAVVDKDVQEKIDAIKTRLITQCGYNDQSATDVLDFAASLFARGDFEEEN